MNNFKMFCMCLNDHHLGNLKKLNYIPVGLGKNHYSNEWLRDNTKDNISEKNSYYGEYSFYYWFWKNMLPEVKDGTWVGFSGYRYHWAQTKNLKSEEITKIVNSKNFSNYIFKNIPYQWEKFECILGEQLYVNKWKFSKMFKHGKKKFFLNPKNLLKKNHNIKLHFDVFHGDGNLDKAIERLDPSERNDFKNFVNLNISFNRENLFFCKSKTLINKYFNSIFDWLKNCEELFGFDLTGYSQKRMYAFLAERYLSYWFNKYSKPLEWPIFFYDTNKNRIEI